MTSNFFQIALSKYMTNAIGGLAMLISGAIGSTLLIGVMTLILLVGVVLIPIERRLDKRRNHK
jgi:ABC-type transport system involved in cytochrome c biogenesis permease component